MFTKTFPCFCGCQFIICTELYDCSLLEMLPERAFLINSAASHVEPDSHCERKACVTTSIFCMYDEKTSLRHYASFHIYIAAHFVIIEDKAILENNNNVEFSKCSIHQILGSFLLLNFKNIDVK